MNTYVLNVMNLPFTIMVNSISKDLKIEKTVKTIHSLLIDADRRFSPFKANSMVSRFQHGDHDVLSDEDFQEVYLKTLLAQVETDGLFDPFYSGVYDPTGVVKGWIVETAFNQVLEPLLRTGQVTAAAINAGGDMIVSANAFQTAWTVGIENPCDPHHYVAAFPLRSGAVATSGSSKRGEHIKRAHHDIVQSTVIADSLVDADVWTTALFAASRDDIPHLIAEHALTAFLVTDSGQYQNYSHGTLVDASSISSHDKEFWR